LLGGAYSQPSDQRLSHRAPAGAHACPANRNHDRVHPATEASRTGKRRSALIDESVWRQEIKRAETGGLDFFERHEIETMGREDARELDGLFRYASNMFASQEKAAIARVLT